MTQQELVEAFIAKAKLVNCAVTEVPDVAAALQYAVEVCEKKAPCEMLADEPGTEQGPLGPNKVPTRVKKVLAAPTLAEADYAKLAAACEAKGILCVKEGLRKYLAGIDVGICFAEAGVAASGTCLVNTDNEDGRLASMICETSMLILRKSAMYPDLPAITQIVRERMGQGPGATYTTLITGPSRTADIERVGAVGVHGPLELHCILLEG